MAPWPRRYQTERMSYRIHSPAGRGCRGLTAFDLVVSLAIIAILTSAAVPAMGHILMHQRMKAAVSQLQSDLALARSEAIDRASRIVTCPQAPTGACADTGTWQHGWLIFQDSNDDRAWQAGEPLLRRASAIDGMQIVSSAHRVRLRFFPNGTAPGSNATLSFCDARGPRATRQLTLSASGRIRLKSGTETDTSACET
jgi:type IV fimbrial biogenesis protein FimT